MEKMLKAIIERTTRENEVRTFRTKDSRVFISIVRRQDGAYVIYVDTIEYDDEEDTHYWSKEGIPRAVFLDRQMMQNEKSDRGLMLIS